MTLGPASAKGVAPRLNKEILEAERLLLNGGEVTNRGARVKVVLCDGLSEDGQAAAATRRCELARCKNCGRSMPCLTPEGLCRECSVTVVDEVRKQAQAIGDLLRIVDGAPELGLRTLICDSIMQHAKALTTYERRGIPTIDPPPSELLRLYRHKKDALIVLALRSEVDWAKDVTEAISLTSTKIGVLTLILNRLREHETKLRDRNSVKSLERTLLDRIDAARLAEYLEEARTAERKGQRTEALDRYRQALSFLRQDDVAARIGGEEVLAIEAKIVELGGGTSG